MHRDILLAIISSKFVIFNAMHSIKITLRHLFFSLLSMGVIVFVPTTLSSCGSHEHHDHETEEHEHNHDHEAEEHDHDHEHGHDHENEDHGKKGSEHGEEGHGAGIHMEPEDAEKYGVVTKEISAGEFREAVKTSAEILPSSVDMATASAPTSGIISLVPGITQGTSVKAGQVVARIKSTGVSGGDANASAKVAIDNAKRELDRVTPLLKDGLVTKKEYNEALAAYEAAKASYSPVAAAGVVTAPRAGVITVITAGEGSFVNTGDPVALISGIGRLTLRALLPIRYSSLVPVLSGVVITPHGASGETIDLSQFGGKFISSSSSASTNSPGYITVYYTFDNSAPVISGSASEVYLQGNLRKGVVSVPISALSEQLGEKFVYVKTGEHEYEKRNVKIGSSNGKEVEVKSGLNSGEHVVINGTTFIRLAEQSTVVPEGHSHNH